MSTLTPSPANFQKDVDQKNSTFWNELCGSHAAKILGIKDNSPASLKKWDNWFFSFYPYLLKTYLTENYSRKPVLEIGLGYGTVGQYLGEQRADYYGLDIALGPVEMMKTRFKQANLSGNIIQGTMLDCPHKDSSFDFVISIGCFHHTGNVQRCLDETYRVLKPGGRALIMVYNRYSLRQWIHWPKETISYWINEQKENSNNQKSSTLEQRHSYDGNSVGDAAPETVFLSINEFKKMCSRFSSFKARKENFDPISILRSRLALPRNFVINTFGRLLGTDVYVDLVK